MLPSSSSSPSLPSPPQPDGDGGAGSGDGVDADADELQPSHSFASETKGCFEAVTQKTKEKIIEHYTIPDSHPTMEEIEADRWVGFPPSFIIPRWGITWYGHQVYQVKFSRWMLLPAALVMQLCVGSLYAWSGYNAAIDEYIFGDDTVGRAPITFYVAVATFGPSAAILGPWLERSGPRTAAIFGSWMYFAAQLLAALAIWLKQIGLLYVGYGVIGGCGLGISYIAPVSPIQKWFPDRRGLASGVAVCGFGAGAIVAPYYQAALIRSVGIVLCFVVLGCAYFVIMMSMAMLLRVPPPGFTVGGVKIYQKAIRGTDTVAEALSQIREARWENQKIIGKTLAEAADTPVTPLIPAAGHNSALALATLGDPASQGTHSDSDSQASADTKLDPAAATIQPAMASADVANASSETLSRGLTAEQTARRALKEEKAILERMDTEEDLLARKQLQDILRGYTLIDAVTSTEFRIMYYMLFANAILGLTTISKLQDMVKNQFSKSQQEAVIINSIASIFNLSGRIVLALASDTTGRKTIFLFTLAVQAIFCGFLPAIFHNQVYWAFVLSICAISLCYGTGFGVIPAFLADMFGAQNVGATHGIILTTWSLGGVVGAIVYNSIVNRAVAEYGKNDPDIYRINFIWITPIIVLGFLVTIFLRTNIQDRLLPRQPKEILRVRAFGRLFFLEKGCRIRLVSKEEETKLFREFLTRFA
ncbi:major facilitator superfamily domain-containing protein [Hyaloraphidium curvatum]|nr:major facilitator superfamily domain-containing protein [Hyaloraphidium curvatum]